MQLSDLDNLSRVFLAEPSTSGRWNEADLTTLINRASRAVSLRISWPEATLTSFTVANQQEYTLPEVLEILRVYVGGQLIYPTDIPTLQQEPQEVYDQSAANSATQWQSQPALAYPVTNADRASPVPGGVGWYTGARPQFYMRGGNLGLVPTPANVVALNIDVVPVSRTLINQTDTSDMPDVAMETIAWKVAAYAHLADGDPNQAAAATQQYESGVADLMTWKRKINRTLPFRLTPFPYRLLYRGPW